MTRPLLLLSLITALGAAPAFAQEDASPEADTQTAAPIGGGLDLGENAGAPSQPAAPAAPQTYVKETFTDWQLQCLPVQDGEDVCQMYQLLTDADGNAVAEASIFRLVEGGQAVAGGTFVVPLETLLTQKLTIAVDRGAARRYDFAFCNRVGCYARVGLTQEDINRFKAGAVAKVSIVPALAPDQRVTVDMSLSGFTAAFEEVSAIRQQ